MREIKSLFERNEYTPLNNVYLNKQNLLHNLNYLKTIIPNFEIFPNLKANAYGHGIVEIAKCLEDQDLKYIVVDSLFEAYEIYKNKINIPILIAGYVLPSNLKVKRLPFSYAVWDETQIKEILSYQPNAKLHLFFDSGMNREGVKFDDIAMFIEKIKKFASNFEGIMSHFASSDDLKSKESQQQIELFQKAVMFCEQSGFNFKYKHLSNSAGIRFQKNDYFNAARVGLSLYGLNPIGEEAELKPVLSLESQIIQIKDAKKNELIGYNGTFKARRDMKIGVLPIGYSDGLNRGLSNKGVVKIHDLYVPIVGRVSMNITTIDITGIENVNIGTRVKIISNKDEDNNSIRNVAKICDTISYVILVGINPFTRRTIV